MGPVGATASQSDYSWDIRRLLARSPTALRKMLEICHWDYNIYFNAKKSKCSIVAPYSQHCREIVTETAPFASEMIQLKLSTHFLIWAML
jgi:hypothetical protein